MAKSVVALLIGIAVKEGAIRSVDDLAETYVPDLKDTEYGRTPIKALLLMASGVAFSEDYNNRSADIYKLARLTIEQDPGGSLAAVKQFNTRRSAPGARFSVSRPHFIQNHFCGTRCDTSWKPTPTTAGSRRLLTPRRRRSRKRSMARREEARRRNNQRRHPNLFHRGIRRIDGSAGDRRSDLSRSTGDSKREVLEAVSANHGGIKSIR